MEVQLDMREEHLLIKFLTKKKKAKKRLSIDDDFHNKIYVFRVFCHWKKKDRLDDVVKNSFTVVFS